LKQEWGKDYDDRMEDARKAFKDMGLEEDVAEEVGKLLGVGNTVKFFLILFTSKLYNTVYFSGLSF
jgi:hypothetical protein